MKKFFVLLLSLCLFAFVSACSDGQNIDSDKQNDASDQIEEGGESNGDSNTRQPVKEKFVINLNLDNYLTYFEVKFTTYQYSSAVSVSGCLSYALYKDVTFTIEKTLGGSVETFRCNAAGNGTSQMTGFDVEVTNVSGQVIYWM